MLLYPYAVTVNQSLLTNGPAIGYLKLDIKINIINSQVETTQEKIISLELTTSPSSETAPTEVGEADINLGEGEVDSGDASLQPDIVQVVNPLLDGGAGLVTAIPVGPSHRLTAYKETTQ